MAFNLSRDDLVAHLREQVVMLGELGRVYDGGVTAAAKQLGTIVRVMVHDTKGSTSVLELLQVKRNLQYLDTAQEVDESNLVATWGLVMMRWSRPSLDVPSEVSWHAGLGDLPPTLLGRSKPFEEWWNDPVSVDNNGERFSRRDFVLGVANKEGGSHVDSKLSARYAALTRDDSLGKLYLTSTGNLESLGSPAVPSVRQIAYELETTVKDQLARYLSP